MANWKITESGHAVNLDNATVIFFKGNQVCCSFKDKDIYYLSNEEYIVVKTFETAEEARKYITFLIKF